MKLIISLFHVLIQNLQSSFTNCIYSCHTYSYSCVIEASCSTLRWTSLKIISLFCNAAAFINQGFHDLIIWKPTLINLTTITIFSRPNHNDKFHNLLLILGQVNFDNFRTHDILFRTCVEPVLRIAIGWLLNVFCMYYNFFFSIFIDASKFIQPALND